MTKVGTALCLALLAAAWATSARAIDDNTKSASRQLAKDAKHDYDAGRFAEASRKFQQAFTATEVPTLALWAARALVKQGQFVAASELYLKATQLQKNELWLGKSQEQAQQAAADERKQLLPRIAQVTITVHGTCSGDVQVTIDADRVPNALLGVARPTDPGPRRIVGRCGADEVVQEVTLKEGEARQVPLKLAPRATPAAAPITAQPAPVAPTTPPATQPNGTAPDQPKDRAQPAASAERPKPAQPSAQRIVGWASLGLGATGVVVGVATGLVVKSRYADYKASCPNHNCDLSVVDQGKLDSYNRWRTVATAGFIVGGIGAAAGVTLLLTSPTQGKDAHVALLVSPNAATLTGSF